MPGDGGRQRDQGRSSRRFSACMRRKPQKHQRCNDTNEHSSPLQPPAHTCVRSRSDPASAMAVAEVPMHCQSARAMKRSSTIDDVARAAGVARVTVSRVLNNGENVRPETRERVRRAVEALGYSVNQQARALASGAGRQIMLIHAHDPEREPNSYYHAGLELGALRACSSLGFDLVTRAIDPEGENPSRLLA